MRTIHRNVWSATADCKWAHKHGLERISVEFNIQIKQLSPAGDLTSSESRLLNVANLLGPGNLLLGRLDDRVGGKVESLGEIL